MNVEQEQRTKMRDTNYICLLINLLLLIITEYGMGSPASTQGDVYGFGILLLEMLTGKRPTDKEFGDTLNLHQFVQTALPDEMIQILDPSLLQEGVTIFENHIDHTRLCDLLFSMFQVGLSCSKESPKERINMKEAVDKLQKIGADLVTGAKRSQNNMHIDTEETN